MLQTIKQWLCKLVGCEGAKRRVESVREVPVVQREHPGDKYHVRTNERVKIGEKIYTVYLYNGWPRHRFILSEGKCFVGLIPGTYQTIR
jgi:hypothetical protein